MGRCTCGVCKWRRLDENGGNECAWKGHLHDWIAFGYKHSNIGVPLKYKKKKGVMPIIDTIPRQDLPNKEKFSLRRSAEGATSLVLSGDSLVIVQTLNGHWRLANKKVRGRVAWAQNAIETLFAKGLVTPRYAEADFALHQFRENNKKADYLAGRDYDRVGRDGHGLWDKR